MNLQVLFRDLLKLNRASTKFGKAPHKPVLVLTLLDLLDEGYALGNKFFINADLVASFHENWNLLVSTGHQEDFTQPFFYLQNDRVGGHRFWFLKPKPGYSINAHIKNINTLSEVLEYASFSTDVLYLIGNPENRILIKEFILQNYFPEQKDFYYSKKEGRHSYIKNLEDYILNEIPVIEKLMVAEEETVYVRNGIFKKWIPKIYYQTCAISGMKLLSTFGFSLVDACHIVPFSVSQDDKVSNGIALCPNLHRAFDRGLITLDNEFKVLVSDQISEDKKHPYGLSNLQGKKIVLPREVHRWPDQGNLEWHRKNIFKG